ncbi:MAG TPA: DUF4855 domain-containing protein [Candidatus Hydrogenedentes bacterium]|nr:DUF4855 domain-containing protein [Candidatus Hydrogenedentota bacterium]
MNGARVRTVWAGALAFCALAAAADPGYFPPGDARTGGMRHLCLVYHGQQRRPAWTEEQLLPYVARVDAEGVPRSWLFDSFLLIEFATDDGKQLYHYDPRRAQPGHADWQWLADAWFREETGLIGLERALERAGTALGDPARVVNVVITLPVPEPQAGVFGVLPGGGAPLDFSRPADRMAALRWYMDTVRARFDAAAYRHLRLEGFYWTGESVSPDLEETVRGTADRCHAGGLRLYWIPYFSARGAAQWRALGFDAMMLQPNYFFEGDGGIARLALAARRARAYGSGVEIEFDGRALRSAEHRQRLFDYLDAGARYGWQAGALTGWYEGGGALGLLARDADPEVRALYDAVCDYVQNRRVPGDVERLPALPEPPAPRGDNLALASRGAKVTGALDNGNPDLAPGKMLDGDTSGYSGSSGLTWFSIPGSVTVELPETARVAETRILFFDLDGRTYTYTVETSADGQIWEPAADHRADPVHGWQADVFSPRAARFLRLTGLTNSTGQPLMQVVEFEAYPAG